jgi:GAF domain-containing protein
LNQIKDIDILMEHILAKARLFANADAGSIYLRDAGHLKFSYMQNDTLQKRLPEGAKLIHNFFEIPIADNSLASYVAVTGKSLNIENVDKIDSVLPYHFNRGFDESSGYSTDSILTIPLKTTRNEIVGIIQLINAKNERGGIIPFSPEIEHIMAIFSGLAGVALERAKMMREMILRTIRMAEMRDPAETGAHVNRVAGYTIEIYETWAHRKGVSKLEIQGRRDVLRMAAMLHDVGKVAIPDAILKKPEKLNDEEFAVMKQHTWMGARLFIDKSSDFDEAAAEVALSHHERWDGDGYPGYVDLATGRPLEGKMKARQRRRQKGSGNTPLRKDCSHCRCIRRSFFKALIQRGME